MARGSVRFWWPNAGVRFNRSLVVPVYDRFLVPSLRGLDEDTQNLSAVADNAANLLNLSDADRRELILFNREPAYVARTREALRDLRRAGLVQEIEAGTFRITDAGRSVLDQKQADLTQSDLAEFPGYARFRARYLSRRGA